MADIIADNLGLTLVERRKGWAAAVNGNFERLSKLHVIDNSGNIWMVNNARYDSTNDSWEQIDTSKASTAVCLKTDASAELLFCESVNGTIVWDYYDSGNAGDIKMTACSTAPAGWLICDGSTISRTTYSRLFAAIGTTYGSGDGSNTFNIPDLQSRFAIGCSTNYALGSTGGEAAHVLTVDELPSHNHRYALYSSASGASQGGGYYPPKNPFYHDTENTGGDQPHNNIPPFLALNYVIKY